MSAIDAVAVAKSLFKTLAEFESWLSQPIRPPPNKPIPIKSKPKHKRKKTAK